jgi:hypothetical protein
MKAVSPADIIVELENAIAVCSPERCARMLWRTVELLVAGNDRLQALHISVLDDVLVRLTERIAPDALVQLSTTFAELRVGPKGTLRRLALHKDPAVASPILQKSPALSQSDLEAVATSCGEQHLLAISGRSEIDGAVTDALVRRGSKKVCLAVIRNPGAVFSDAAYSTLVDKAAQDGEITKALVLRPATPDLVVRKLLSPSSLPREAVASKSDVSSALREQGAASAPASAPVVPKRPRAADYANARPEIVALNRIGKLNDSTVNRFAIRRETANLYTALSVLSGAPIDMIEHVMASVDCEGLVMACRASRLNWQTTLAILSNRGGAHFSVAERERAQQLFETLHLSTSQWTVRWGEMAASVDGHDTKSGASR